MADEARRPARRGRRRRVLAVADKLGPVRRVPVVFFVLGLLFNDAGVLVDRG